MVFTDSWTFGSPYFLSRLCGLSPGLIGLGGFYFSYIYLSLSLMARKHKNALSAKMRHRSMCH